MLCHKFHTGIGFYRMLSLTFSLPGLYRQLNYIATDKQVRFLQEYQLIYWFTLRNFKKVKKQKHQWGLASISDQSEVFPIR